MYERTGTYQKPAPSHSDPAVCDFGDTARSCSQTVLMESRAQVEALCAEEPTCTGYVQAGLSSEATAYYLYGPDPVGTSPIVGGHGNHQCYMRQDDGTFVANAARGMCNSIVGGVEQYSNDYYLCPCKGACRGLTGPPNNCPAEAQPVVVTPPAAVVPISRGVPADATHSKCAPGMADHLNTLSMATDGLFNNRATGSNCGKPAHSTHYHNCRTTTFAQY